jgi:hypothetical protein
MLVISPDGPLYASLKMSPILVLEIMAGDKNALTRLIQGQEVFNTPEAGIHWITILTFAEAAFLLYRYMQKQHFQPVFSAFYTILVTGGATVFPFEWFYTGLADIFHNDILQGGTETVTFYGWWQPYFPFSFNSVIGRNGFLTLMLPFALIFFTLQIGYRPKLHFDRVSLVLGLATLGGFAVWVLLPLIHQVPFEKGSIWFPQTVYAWYVPLKPVGYDVGYFIDIRDDVIRGLNVAVKCLAVAWTYYTFAPRHR